MWETKIPNPSINNKVIERFTSGITENDVLKEESFPFIIPSDTKEKLLNKRQRLILEISQDCNNRCYYCTYSGKYSTHRVHRGVSMTFDIAIKAIEDFLEHSVDAKVRAITFYGGEPLLEFELIKQIITYLEDKGIECYFSISTNGALLTEEIIDWLVNYKFNTGKYRWT
ncbi:MAG: radical SAM protein [Candidatus Coatesbacteria bacterium]|nr:radical SAM protein [Candidatus Coatesbacteria bacterium]